MKLISFNTNGAKRNISFIQSLLYYDLIYICETWLIESESISYLKNLSKNYLLFYNSDMLISPRVGRPYGGRSFLINKKITIIKHEFINPHISYISFIHLNKTFTVLATYFPFDNGSILNFTEFQSCLQIIYELYTFYDSLKHSIIIIGDFNADLLRNNRFDIIFSNYIKKNNFAVLTPSYDFEKFSYYKGEYRAKLDHCLMSKFCYLFKTVCVYLESDINLSDHKTIFICISWMSDCMIENNFSKNCEQEDILINI